MATTPVPFSSADGTVDKRTALLVAVALGVMGTGVIWLAKQEEQA
jgi:hypothetical protein